MMQASFTTLRLQHDLQIQYTAECEQKQKSYLLNVRISEAPRSDGTVVGGLKLFPIRVCPVGFSEDICQILRLQTKALQICLAVSKCNSCIYADKHK